MTQRIITINSPYYIKREELESPADLAKRFPVNRPLALEIGCGTGHFIVELAVARPETNFLAIDIYNKRCLKTCRKIEEAGLDNVLVMRIEARFLLLNFIARESLAGVFINCPDPWPKKRHRSRRLVNGTFLELLLHYLKPDADFYFSTDFTDYAEQVGETLPAMRGYRNCLKKPVVTDLPGYPISKYMQRFLDRGQPIYFMHYRRQPDLTLAETPAPDIRAGFRTRWGKVGNE